MHFWSSALELLTGWLLLWLLSLLCYAGVIRFRSSNVISRGQLLVSCRSHPGKNQTVSSYAMSVGRKLTSIRALCSLSQTHTNRKCPYSKRKHCISSAGPFQAML